MSYMELPTLPILTPMNKTEHPLWHEYYEKVYQHPVRTDVDLNNFTWFYWCSPLGRVDTMILPYNNLDVPLNTPYIFKWEGLHPELQFAKIGFYVRRKMNPAIFSSPLLEVHRTDIPYMKEIGVAWFYLTIGSGFYLNVKAVRPKQIYIVKSPHDFDTQFNDHVPFHTMYKAGAKVLIFTDRYKNGLIEVVYRLRSPYMLGNTADIPMYHGVTPYQHKYSTEHRCLM